MLCCMSFQTINKTITGDSPGRNTQLNYFKIGPKNANKKVFLQAALHADEQPGILVLHHLLELLIKADKNNCLKARFVVFPMVNPLGMSDIGFLQHQGRYDRTSGVNFNRQWPDLANAISSEIAKSLTDNAQTNTKIIRSAVQQWLENNPPTTALEQQRHFVMHQAFDADYVFDLHCDNEALMHIFSVPHHKQSLQSLSHWIGASALLLADDSGGNTFEEIWPFLWLDLAKNFPDLLIEMPVLAATIEYRGTSDTHDELNFNDAQRLYGFFQDEGLITGDLILSRPNKGAQAIRLDATELVRVNQTGLLAYKVKLGDEVSKGDVIADLLLLDGEQAFTKRVPIVAGTSGIILSLNQHKYVWPGCSIAKVVGMQTLASRQGKLLED